MPSPRSRLGAALELTAEQRDQIRAIEEESLFAWMKGGWSGGMGKAAGQDAGSQERPAKERILALLTEGQARKWQEMTGEPFRGSLLPFPLPYGPPHGPNGPRP